jgi:hypothetical protein
MDGSVFFLGATTYSSLQLLECIIFEFTGSWCKEQLDTCKSSLDVLNQKETKL